MAENSRIDDLRRRVEKDPASIAFAQLAEECRRAGQCQEAVDVCRAGLDVHPTYLSARVTLGRALLELGQLDEAHVELTRVLDGATDNLAAIRGLAEIHDRRGELAQALVHYRAALILAPNDPDLEETVNDLTSRLDQSSEIASATAQEDESVPEPPADSLALLAALQGPETRVGDTLTPATDDRTTRMVAALEHWLDAIHVARADPHP
jgi:Flp pilus assembly protein TadD